MQQAVLHVPLDTPPQAITLTVRNLLHRMRAGGIRVPVFQRPLRWKASDVVRLFDSMNRGYPIGSLLFWKRPAEEDPDHRLGEANFPLPAHGDAWWIVDGQQRVTALTASLLDLVNRGSQWRVHLDPISGQFHSGAPPIHEQGRFVPLHVLGDLRRLGRWLRDSRLSEQEEIRVEDIQQRILDFQLSAYLMETSNPEALKGVFARMNSTGVRMRADEVFQALLGESTRPKGGLSLTELQTGCDLDGFGEPPRSEILKAVMAMSGFDPVRRPEELPEKSLAQIVSFGDAELALARTVRFLTAPQSAQNPGASVPCYALLPYPVVFPILARFFFLHQEPPRETLLELSRWMWCGVVTGSHERAEVSRFRRQVREIEGNDVDHDLKALRRSSGAPERVDWVLDRFHARSAKSRVEILAMLELTPRHREGLVSWRSLVSAGERVAREIFAVPSLNGEPDTVRELAKTAANRVLSDARHTGLKVEFLTWNRDLDEQALSSHLLSGEIWDALAVDPGLALRLRASRLQAHVSDFLNRRSGLNEPELRPLEAYQDTEFGVHG